MDGFGIDFLPDRFSWRPRLHAVYHCESSLLPRKNDVFLRPWPSTESSPTIIRDGVIDLGVRRFPPGTDDDVQYRNVVLGIRCPAIGRGGFPNVAQSEVITRPNGDVNLPPPADVVVPRRLPNGHVLGPEQSSLNFQLSGVKRKRWLWARYVFMFLCFYVFMSISLLVRP